MSHNALSYLILSIVVTLVAILFCTYNDASTLNILMSSVLSLCCFPLLAFTMRMWMTGEGSKWINGIDWRNIPIENERECASFIGKWMTVGMGILTIAIFGILGSLILCVILIGISVIIMIYPMFTIGKDGKHKGKNSYYGFSDKKSLAITALAMVIILAPSVYFFNQSFESENVTITFNEDEFTVKAPMFNHTFQYSDITEQYIDDDFDKGKRIMGYGTPTISSGKFSNSEFGKYELASFTKVASCIVISVDGNIYAFNQSSNEETHDAYDELVSRLSNTI